MTKYTVQAKKTKVRSSKVLAGDLRAGAGKTTNARLKPTDYEDFQALPVVHRPSSSYSPPEARTRKGKKRRSAALAGLFLMNAGLQIVILGSLILGFFVYTYYQKRPPPDHVIGQDRIRDSIPDAEKPQGHAVSNPLRERSGGEAVGGRNFGHLTVSRRQKAMAYQRSVSLEAKEKKLEHQIIGYQEAEQQDIAGKQSGQYSSIAGSGSVPGGAKDRGQKHPVGDTQETEGGKNTAALHILKESIVKISPGIFHSVRLELADSSYIESEDDWRRDIELNAVRKIEIDVNSQQWGRMSCSEKLDMLYQTFDLLRCQYPQLARFLKLRFDDSRKDFELDFGKYDNMRVMLALQSQ